MPGAAMGLIVLVLVLILIAGRAVHREKPAELILLYVKNRENEIEGTLRLLLFKNPRAQIYVVDRGSRDDTPKILRRLAEDYPRIHVRF